MRRITIVALLVLAACHGTTEPIPGPTGSDIILELGQATRLSGTTITVSLQSVEDSRCHPDMQCVWEGNAKVALGLSDAGGPEVSGELNTQSSFPRALTFRYVRIELTELEPLPTGTRPVVVYRAHLRWSYLPD